MFPVKQKLLKKSLGADSFDITKSYFTKCL